MKESGDVIACVFDNDNGLFAVPLAERLARGFKKVYLFTPWEQSFSTINKAIVGDGFEAIERVDDIWGIKKDVDLFVFPDIQHSGLQLELESQGKAVWGSRAGDSLEVNRQLFLKTLKDVGLSVPTFTVQRGLTALRAFLKDKEDRYIKISKYRGSLETSHWRSWGLDSGLLDLWAVKFGPAAELIPFLVFEPIDTELEIGGDTYCVDGQWPSLMLHGIEWKDECYLGAVTKRTDMPKQIQEILEAFGPVLNKFRYRNQWSMEDRTLPDDHFFIDATCRGGLPSSASQYEAWKNWPDIVWQGANGQLVDPDPAGAFTAEAAVSLKGDRTQWRTVDIPKEIRRWIKLANCCEIDGVVTFPPDGGDSNMVGWLVAVGKSPEDVILKINEYADQLPDGMSANTECLAYVLKEIHAEQEQGIKFTDKSVPEPSFVMED